MSLFELHDTIGLPLDIIAIHLRSLNAPIDFASFCRDAAKAGWKPQTICATVREAATLPELYKTIRELALDFNT